MCNAGFGLSYTTFAIGNAQVNKTKVEKDEALKLTIPVTNNGKREGAEIVQVYVKKLKDVDGAIKTLRGFQRVSIMAGKTTQAAIDLHYKAFEFFNSASGKVTVAPGEYEIWYGNSTATKDLKVIKISVM